MGMYAEFILEDKRGSKRQRREQMKYERRKFLIDVEEILGQSVFDHELVKGKPAVIYEIKAAASFDQVVRILEREKRLAVSK